MPKISACEFLFDPRRDRQIFNKANVLKIGFIRFSNILARHFVRQDGDVTIPNRIHFRKFEMKEFTGGNE